MSRIKVNLPDPIIFSTELSIRVSDINYGNHMGNDRVLTLAHDARLKWLNHLGFKNELDFPDNVGTIIADAGIMFRGEAYYGDILKVNLGIENPHKKGFDLIHSMIRTKDNLEIARVKVALLFFNYRTKKVTNIPEELLGKLPDAFHA